MNKITFSDKNIQKLFDENKSRLTAYAELLLDWNSVTNIIGSKNIDDIITELLYISLNSVELFSGKIAIDVGSGGGIVGIPVSIALPRIKMFHVEPDPKKCAFLVECIRQFELKNSRVLPVLFDDLTDDDINGVDCLFVRGLKIEKISNSILKKFPRGTTVIYFSSTDKITLPRFSLVTCKPVSTKTSQNFILELKSKSK